MTGDAFFPYRFDRFVATLLRPLGVRPGEDGVTIGPGGLRATYGRFAIRVPIENLAAARVTGPYRWYRALGPRGSLADHGMTFGTSTRAGTLVEFVRPIPRVIGPWDHPNATLTVADPERLARAVSGYCG